MNRSLKNTCFLESKVFKGNVIKKKKKKKFLLSSGKIVQAVCILHDFYEKSWTGEGLSKTSTDL